MLLAFQADSRYNLESKENGNNLVISLSELTDEGKGDWGGKGRV